MNNSVSKKIKGSAISGADGSFSFIPYVSTPPAEKTFKLVKSGKYASLWIGKKNVSVRITFQKNAIPPYPVWVEEITNMYNSLYKEPDIRL